MKAQYQNENGEMVDLNTEVVNSDVIVGETTDINVTDAEVVTPETV